MAEQEKHVPARSDSENTPVVRVAYPYIHEKQTKRRNGAPRKTPRYEATLLFPKLNADPAHCANYQFLMRHMMEAATKKWGSWPAGGFLPIEDGDVPYKAKVALPGQPAPPAVDPNKYAWRRGNWIVEVTNYFDPGPPVAVMNAGQRLDIPARVINGKAMYKGGDFAIIHIHAYTFHNDKFGVNFGFSGILWMGEGEAIGSSGPKSTDAMFGQVPQTPGMQTAGAQLQVAAMPMPQMTTAPVAPQPQYAPSPPMAPAQQQYAPAQQQYAPAPQAMPMPPAAPVAPVPGQVGLPPLPR